MTYVKDFDKDEVKDLEKDGYDFDGATIYVTVSYTHLQVVGGLVQQEDVGPREHHPGQHTAHLLTAGEDLHRLVYLVPGEEHPAQEAPEVLLLGIGGELA